MSTFCITEYNPLFDEDLTLRAKKEDRHTTKYSVYDDDDEWYWSGYLDEEDEGVTGDAWNDTYEFGSWYAGTAHITPGHSKTLDRSKGVIG